MFVATVLAALRRAQGYLSLITLLELTTYLFPLQYKIQPNSSFDFVIVGGGSAGSVIATRLAQLEKYTVLLIEAGGVAPYETTFPALVPYLPKSHVDWNYTAENDKKTSQCQDDNTRTLVMGKMLGGSGELQYMMYSRGHPDDYDEWSKITKDSAWKWKNVLPQFKKLEAMNNTGVANKNHELYGTKGNLGITRDAYPDTSQYLKGFKQAGKPIIANIDGNNIGYSRGLILVNNNERQGVIKYLSLVRKSKFLFVARHAFATRIIIKNKKAVGVEVITKENKKIQVIAKQEVIVSAGTIKTPQILMLSGIGPKNHLKKMNIDVIVDLPVGKNLSNHPAAVLFHKTNKPAESFSKRNDPRKYPAGLFIGYASLNRSTRCSHGKPVNYSKPDYETMGLIMKNKTFLAQFCTATLNFKTNICQKLYTESKRNEVLATLITRLRYKSRGEVLLRSRNPKDSPNVYLNYYSNYKDLDDLVLSVKDYLKVEKTEAFKRMGVVRIDPTSPKCDGLKKGGKKYWRCYISCMTMSLGHYTSTCAMGSVVNGRLKVYGVDKLRVADASIMPNTVRGNTYIPVIMIAEKAAEMIIEEMKRRS